jgi:hypothetical protein
MQAAALTNQFIRRPQMQMVRIAQLHLAANIFQILGTERTLNGTLSAHIHKDRGLYCTMGTGKLTPTSLSLGSQ